MTAGLYIAGHFNADLKNFEQVVESPVAGWLGRALYYVLPNFAAFDVKAQVVHGLPVERGYLALTVAYGLAYLARAGRRIVMIFSRRDFK